MTTIIKMAAAISLNLMMLSCQIVSNIGPGERGDGNVQSEDRVVSNFNKIEVSNGIDLYLTQGTEESLVVQADSNLLEFIKTEVSGGTLRVFTEKNIHSAASRKVKLTFKNLEALTANSGSDVLSNSLLELEDLKVSASSGADVDVELNAQNVIARSSSGSDIYLSGTAQSIDAEASSGSSVKATKLKAENGSADSSSGADVSINVSGKLTASASSGGDVTYYGNPKVIDKNKSSGGRVRSRN
jgi:hypothetical protein